MQSTIVKHPMSLVISKKKKNCAIQMQITKDDSIYLFRRHEELSLHDSPLPDQIAPETLISPNCVRRQT